MFGSINKVRAASLDSYRHEGRRHYLSPESRRGTETVNTLGGTSCSEHSISSAVQSAQCSAAQRGAGGGQHIAWLTGELLHQICYSRFYLSVVDLGPVRLCTL